MTPLTHHGSTPQQNGSTPKIGSHDSVEEHLHARLDILRYLMKCFNGGGRILAVQHDRVCVQASGALQATRKQKMVKANSQYLTQGWAKGLGVATSFCCISKRRAPRGRPPGTLYCVGHACKTPGRYNFPGNVYFRCDGSLGPTTSANFSTGYRRTGDFTRTGATPKGPWFGVVVIITNWYYRCKSDEHDDAQ